MKMKSAETTENLPLANSTVPSVATPASLMDQNEEEPDSVLASAIRQAISSTLPEANATSYTFTMTSTLFTLLGNFSGKHDFTLTVIDANNNSKSATLTINN